MTKKPKTEVVKIRIRRDTMAKIREESEKNDRTIVYTINDHLKNYYKIQ